MSTFTRGTLTIAYDIVGTTGAGRAPAPLVIVHGLGAGRREWEAFTAVGADAVQGPIVVYDLRGHGDSNGGEIEASIATLSDDLLALLDHLGIAAPHLLGHSLGGVIALDSVLRAPHRVSSLILLSTTPEAARPAPAPARGGTSLAAGASEDGAPVASEPAVVAARYRATTTALTSRPNLTPRLNAIHVPTLVAVGEFDPLPVQRGAELLHGWIATSRLIRLPGAGHHAHREQPRALAQLVGSFLNEVDRSG